MTHTDTPEMPQGPEPEPGALVPRPGAFEAFQNRERALAEATTPEQLLDLAAKMAAIGRYFRTAERNLAALQEAAMLRLRALRKLPPLIAEVGFRRGRPKKVTLGNIKPKRTLESMGITRRDAAKWKKLAAIPEPDFRGWCRQMVDAGRVITEKALLDAERERLDHLTGDIPEQPWTVTDGLRRLRRTLDMVLARRPGEEDRGAIAGELRAWAARGRLEMMGGSDG